MTIISHYIHMLRLHSRYKTLYRSFPPNWSKLCATQWKVNTTYCKTSKKKIFIAYLPLFTVTEYSFGKQYSTASDVILPFPKHCQSQSSVIICASQVGGQWQQSSCLWQQQQPPMQANHPFNYSPIGGVFFQLMKRLCWHGHSSLNKALQTQCGLRESMMTLQTHHCARLTAKLNGLLSELPRWSSLNLPQKGAVKDWISAFLCRQTVGNPHLVSLEQQINVELDKSSECIVLLFSQANLNTECNNSLLF